jgi:hypothetical protein
MGKGDWIFSHQLLPLLKLSLFRLVALSLKLLKPLIQRRYCYPSLRRD